MKLIVAVGVNDNRDNVKAQRLCERLQAVLDNGTVHQALESGMNARISLEVEGVAPCPITHKSAIAERQEYLEILEEFVRTLEQPGSPLKKLARTYLQACRALHHKPIISEAR
ncbi:MAG TPA: hypothetical protein VGM05_11500 [Planctomycetaceae bacterium]|jgi:hypothetical protein